MSAENKAIVRRFFELFSRGDLETIGRELLSPEIAVHFPGAPGPLNLEGYRQVGIMFRAAFPDIQDTVEDQITDGDKVVTRITSHGTHLGEFMGIPATGKQYTATGIVIDRFTAGRIVERWANFDQLGMLQQLGVIPAPGQG